MPFVTVHMWPGRSQETKKAIIKGITEALQQAAGIPPEATQVVLIEVPQEHWGIGGQPASERQAAAPRAQ
jgi:4-oxalocrotonate tautomerase